MTDEQLVRNFLKNRSEKAFTELYNVHTPWLYQMAKRLTRFDENRAGELVQEVWIVAIRKLETFEWKATLRTWLYKIMFNKFRNNSRYSIPFSTIISKEPSYNPDYRKLDLEQAFIMLPDGYREVIILHDIEGYKHREIAVILEISEGTSKSQLFHARRKMRELLDN